MQVPTATLSAITVWATSSGSAATKNNLLIFHLWGIRFGRVWLRGKSAQEEIKKSACFLLLHMPDLSIRQTESCSLLALCRGHLRTSKAERCAIRQAADDS